MEAAEVSVCSDRSVFPCQVPVNSLPPPSDAPNRSPSVLPTSEPSLDTVTVKQAEMYSRFQAWALRNYGDSGKTKTVTRRKYERIRRILTGEETPTSDNSKFRFWVKGKGFRLGPSSAASVAGYGGDSGVQFVLYVPCREKGAAGLGLPAEREYKRVAVVEDFFNIIYNVHVEMDGRGGKHAGQKRTYKAIAEMYSFLPREAVTRFLMSCADCQKRMHISSAENNNIHNVLSDENHDADDDENDDDDDHHTTRENFDANEMPLLDYRVPITTTYLRGLKKIADRDSSELFVDHNEDSMSSGASEESSHERSPQEDTLSASKTEYSDDSLKSDSISDCVPNSKHLPRTPSSPLTISTMTSNGTHANNSLGNCNISNHGEDIKPLMIVTENKGQGHPERKRRASDDSLDSSTKASEAGVDDLKDEDDDNDDDDDDKLHAQDIDPERLKAFNMFVRLFVDENLDRSIPISKQPKDKIQAILEACDRQFPEFHDRSRKRIRTYLKSCRRMRRSKDGNGFEMMRPTPPHLTSAAAETILAQACENEGSNAKRMRMGLEPLPAVAMQSGPSPLQSCQRSNNASPSPNTALSSSPTPAVLQSLTSSLTPSIEVKSSDGIRQNHTPGMTFRHPHDIPSPFFAANCNGLFRPPVGSAYQPPAHHHSRNHPQTSHLSNSLQNGPTDLSMKKSTTSSPAKSQQLNPAEVATIKQLIAGYRESAAFLYRSADELEQLLLHQN